MPTTSTSPTRGYRPALLRAARASKGWTKQQLIRALRTAAADDGTILVGDASLSRAISGWENGHHYPTQYVDLLCTVYARPAHELGLAETPTADDVVVPDAGYPVDAAATVDTVTALWRADLDPAVSARELSLDPTAWPAASLRWLVAADGEPLPEPRPPTRIGPADVATVAATIDAAGPRRW